MDDLPSPEYMAYTDEELMRRLQANSEWRAYARTPRQRNRLKREHDSLARELRLRRVLR